MKSLIITNSFLLFHLLSITLIHYVTPIRCIIGYGQRGKKAANEITWTRDCPTTNYCFEAVTSDITKMEKLIFYPWNSYYSQYFIRSCGGDYGTPLNYHPWRGLPKSARVKVGSVKLNITTTKVITGQGGTEELDLYFTCRQDLCSTEESGSSRTWTPSFWMTLCLSLLVIITSQFLFLY